jgi:hypothetical protein
MEINFGFQIVSVAGMFVDKEPSPSSTQDSEEEKETAEKSVEEKKP